MSVFGALDATRICGRHSARLADPSAWALTAPTPPRLRPNAERTGYSWWALPRNPNALLVTGMLMKDAISIAIRQARGTAAGG